MSANVIHREADHVRKIPRAAVELWIGADEEDLSHEAFAFLNEMEDLAIVPVLESALRDDVETVTAAMALVTEQEIRLRNRVMGRLETWLADRRPLPRRCAILTFDDTNATSRRVCDEAYLALLRMSYTGADDEVLQRKFRQYLALPESHRDRVIDSARGIRQVV